MRDGLHTILIVDDDALSREILSLLLQAEGYVVETAVSGDEALAGLAERIAETPPPDLVLSDLQMPGTTGNALGRSLREACGKAVILLAMSGSSVPPEAISEFDGFLQKPFTMAALHEAVSEKQQKRIRTGTVEQENSGAGVTEVICLDDGIYRKLRGVMTREKTLEMYAFCLDDAQQRIASMHEAVRADDDVSYRKEAHTIKGGCGMLGAVELSEVARTMETHGLKDVRVEETLATFVAAVERLRRKLGTLK